jgi:hypothetical protein
MVPAVTISPSLNLVRAKSLAAASVSKVLVKRGCRRLNSVPSVGTSNVTYQVWFMPFRDYKKPPPIRSDDGFFLYLDLQTSALPPRANAIDATIHVATGVMTNRSARHRTRP